MGRVLLFGGAFNPPHRGHEALLEAAVRALSPELTFVCPTACSPHKQSGEIKFAHRFAMCGTFKRFGCVTVSGLEHRGRKRRNYSIQTVRRIEKRYPGREICLLIGGDMLESFCSWSRYRRILSKATLVVAAREGGEDGALREAAGRLRSEGGKILFLRYAPVEASSSEIRALLERGEDASPYLGEHTRNYIKKNRLYQTTGE